VFAEAGMMRLSAGRDEVFVPPTMAAHVPIGLDHALAMQTPVRLRTLYLRAGLGADPPAVRVLATAPLLRALIARIVAIGALSADDPDHRAYARILVAEIAGAAESALTLRRPADPRAARAADLAAAGDDDLATIARRAGASARTLQRLFEQETGLGFARWRQHRRLLDAALALSDGANVAGAALAARYDSPSAFVAAFRAHFGDTPRRWAQARRAP
jgi:AraC-like DNA-binding protein